MRLFCLRTGKETNMRVWVAVITHRHGNDILVALSKPDVLAEVYKYVKGSWGEVLEGHEIPNDHVKAIDQYFDATEGDEYCDIDFQDVKPKSKTR